MVNFPYRGEDGANQLIASYGSLENCIRAQFGEPYDGCKDGDVLLYDLADGQQIAGIVYKSRGVVRTKNGLMDWPLEGARFVWDYEGSANA